MKIRYLNISARARDCLLNAGYEEIEELKWITDEELTKIKNINENCVKEIRGAIDEYFGRTDETEDLIGFEEDEISFYNDDEDELSFDSDDDNECALLFDDEDKDLFVESLAEMGKGLIELQKELNDLRQLLAGNNTANDATDELQSDNYNDDEDEDFEESNDKYGDYDEELYDEESLEEEDLLSQGSINSEDLKDL